jgi:hypothetical protein
MQPITRKVLCLTYLAASVSGGAVIESASSQEVKFDVNDVSYLWPPPKTTDDVNRLISADDKMANDSSPFWPQTAFETVLREAQNVSVINSAGATNKIEFRGFREAFAKPSTWKLAGFRVDPSAPGTAPMFTNAFGSVPQIRLIMQPVTVNDAGTVKVHDVAAHLVFNYVLRFDPPPAAGAPPKAVPDRERFSAIVTDLKALKADLAAAGIATTGKLTVHPGFTQDAASFRDKVKGLLAKHLSAERLAAVAFMGLEPPEPWIFFAMTNKDGALAKSPHPSLGGESAQMLTFRGGTHVMPPPMNRNLETGQGVSTASLFGSNVEEVLNNPVLPNHSRPTHADIPDIIANPQRSTFFNTDCVSCHSESARRKELALAQADTTFRYVPSIGISSVDEGLLPKDRWNVRNFGWFPVGPLTATATMRTANEAAESAEYINREYLNPPP